MAEGPKDAFSSLDLLTSSSLYIFLERHPDPTSQFHWGLYHHANLNAGGFKFDIVQPGGVWQPAVSYTGVPHAHMFDGPQARWPLGCMLWLGRVPELTDAYRAWHTLIREEDERLNEVNSELNDKLSCRVYVERACARLRKAGLLVYPEWPTVQEEVLVVGRDCVRQDRLIVVEAVVASTTEANKCY